MEMAELGVCSDEQGCRCGPCSRSLPLSKEKARNPPELQDAAWVNDHLDRKEEKKAAKKEKADAGLAAAREQEHQHMEEPGPELPRPRNAVT